MKELEYASKRDKLRDTFLVSFDPGGAM